MSSTRYISENEILGFTRLEFRRCQIGLAVMKIMENYDDKALSNLHSYLNQIQKIGMILQLHKEDFTKNYWAKTFKQIYSKSLLYYWEKALLCHVLRLFMIYVLRIREVSYKMICLSSQTRYLYCYQTYVHYLYLNFDIQTLTQFNLIVTAFPKQ